MSDLALSVPIAAKRLLDAIVSCAEETVWTSYPDGSPATYLHPLGKVVFQGVVNPGDTRPDGTKWQGKDPMGKVVFQGVVNPGDTRPDGTKWQGKDPMYLVVYNHPRNKPGMCDAHWLSLDVLEVAAMPVVDALPENAKPAEE